MLTPSDAEAFQADVLRRAIRLERRRRRERTSLAAAVASAIAISAAILAVVVVRERPAGPAPSLSATATPSATVQVRPVPLPGEGSTRLVLSDGGGSTWVVGRTSGNDTTVARFEDGRMATSTPLPEGADPRSVQGGSDGALWMTDPAGTRVLRVARDGRLSVVGLRATPSATAVFVGERLWFADRRGGRLMGVGPTGGVVQQALGAGRAPGVIGAAADGALWFGDADRAELGSVSAAGAVSRYPLASADERVVAMSVGPGLALWFLVRSDTGTRIGRIDGAGHVVEDDVESSTVDRALTLGPDGSLWFTSGDGARLWRRSPSGLTSTTLEHPVRAVSWAIAPDGQAWAVDADTQSVVALTVS